MCKGLTKNYLGRECSASVKDVHTVCCKNLLHVDKRKQVKIRVEWWKKREQIKSLKTSRVFASPVSSTSH